MADSSIEVEWIASAQKMNQALGRLEQKFDKQEKQLQKIGNTSKKSANDAAVAFNKLEMELKDNEKALKKLQSGSAEYDKQKQKVDRLRESLAKAKNELKSASKTANPWNSIGPSMVTAAGSAMQLFSALKRVADAQRAVAAGGADLATDIDTLSRKLQVQAGLTDPERRAKTEKILAIASQDDIGLPGETGLRAATQLQSSGFADPTDDGSVETILATIQATNFDGQVEGLVKGFSQTLEALGQDKTNENLKALAIQAQSGFQNTDFQIADLQQFAKQSSVFENANLTQQESFAGFMALRKVITAEEAGTGLKNFITTMQKGDLTKEGKDNFERIGVNPEDVDFVGENLTEVLTTLKAGFDSLSESDRNAAIVKQFGKDNLAATINLLNKIDDIKSLESIQDNKEGFRKAQLANASGMQAERNRIENKRMLDIMPNAEALSELDNELTVRENRDIGRVEEATIKGGAMGGSTMAVMTEVNQGVDGVLGDDVNGLITRSTINPALGLLKLIDMMMTDNSKAQSEQLEVQKQQLAVQQRLEQAGRQPAPQAPPVSRPKESPLPATTAP